jgi:hypothetical protein
MPTPKTPTLIICPEKVDRATFPTWVNSISESAALTLVYAPIDLIPYWEENFKKHDIGAIWQSIDRYGFRDPFAWDKHLNDGNGGIVEGNGRREALEHGFKAGQKAPRGIMVKEGRWYAPLLIGVDSTGEREAIAYGTSHNVLTMSGGDFSAYDISKMFEPEAYLETLQDLAEFELLPIPFEGDYIDSLLEQMAQQNEELDLGGKEKGDRGSGDGKKEIDCVCPSCGHSFIRQMGG